MPKTFGMHIEVEEIAVGRVMRMLHNTPGVAKVDLDLGTPKKKANGPGHGKTKSPPGQRVQDRILQLIAGKPHQRKDLTAVFGVGGMSQLHKLHADGLAKKSADGMWSATTKGLKLLDSFKQSKSE